MGKLIDNLDLRGPPVGTIIDCRAEIAERERQKNRGPNCALESDPVFGTILIVVLTFVVGGVTGGYGAIPFLIWALWLGLKPFEQG